MYNAFKQVKGIFYFAIIILIIFVADWFNNEVLNISDGSFADFAIVLLFLSMGGVLITSIESELDLAEKKKRKIDWGKFTTDLCSLRNSSCVLKV